MRSFSSKNRLRGALMALTATLGLVATSAAVDLEPARAARLGGQVYGGVDADTASTPWFAQVITRNSMCGGTFVSPRHVLTAAHCVDGARASRVRVIANPSFSGRGYRSSPRAVKVYVNPKYDSESVRYDAAIIEMPSAITRNFLAINADPDFPQVRQAMTVYGYGAKRSGGYSSRRMRQAEVLDLSGPAGRCGGYRNSFDVDSMVCARGIAMQDACQGDSGGPLVATVGQRQRLVGIVSWGQDCGDPSYPGVYTRVSAVSDWARQIVGPSLKARGRVR